MVYLKFALFGEGSPAKIQQRHKGGEVLFPVGAVKLFFFFFLALDTGDLLAFDFRFSGAHSVALVSLLLKSFWDTKEGRRVLEISIPGSSRRD